MQNVEVTRTYLRLDHPERLRGDDPGFPEGISLTRLSGCTPEKYRSMYEHVGGEWNWRDRNAWGDEQLADYLSGPSVGIWELRDGDQTAGYFELLAHEDQSVEIVYFGLARSHFGRGLGRSLLIRAAREAFGMGARQVWLHTCTLDGPAALPNYIARGFEPYKEEKYQVTLP
jgi:GNAT superfamily N-acetyltransferase